MGRKKIVREEPKEEVNQKREKKVLKLERVEGGNLGLVIGGEVVGAISCGPKACFCVGGAVYPAGEHVIELAGSDYKVTVKDLKLSFGPEHMKEANEKAMNELMDRVVAESL